jgi:hypothetical protein
MRRRAHRAFHHAVRYAPIVRALRSLPAGARVLEVGSGVEGLGAFWPGRFVGADVDFRGPRAANLLAVTADGARLPFADRSFDLVVSVDVLTELPREILPAVCAEMARVTRGRVLILAVTGAEAEASDRRMRDWLVERGRPVPDWLVLQLQTGCPTTESVRDLLAGHGRVRVGANMSVGWHERMFRLEHRLARARAMTVLQPLVRAWGRAGARELPGQGAAYRHRFLLETQPTDSPPRAAS